MVVEGGVPIVFLALWLKSALPFSIIFNWYFGGFFLECVLHETEQLLINTDPLSLFVRVFL